MTTTLTAVHDPAQKNCVLCFQEFGFCQRPAPYGTKTRPLCRTHALAKRNAERRNRHRTTVEKNFNLDPGQYDKLKAYQGGKCAICKRATGAKRNLAVDHDHKHCNQCAGKGSCGKGVRGLLCMRCNSLLAHIRDDKETARRVFEYLDFPPFQRMTGELPPIEIKAEDLELRIVDPLTAIRDGMIWEDES